MDKVLSDIEQLKADAEAVVTPVTGPTVADVVSDLKSIVEKYDVIVPVEPTV